MKDYVFGELNKAHREFKEHVELEVNDIDKKIDSMETDVRRVRDLLGE
jgi:hypothetical protein